MWLWLLPLLKAAGVGAAVGAGTAAATGGDAKKGALMGAAGGGLSGGLGGLFGGTSGGAAGGSTGGAASGGSAAGGAATAAAKSGFTDLLKKSAIDAGVNMAVSEATPKYGMTQPGQVPALSSEDPMLQLQQLMEQMKQRRTI